MKNDIRHFINICTVFGRNVLVDPFDLLYFFQVAVIRPEGRIHGFPVCVPVFFIVKDSLMFCSRNRIFCLRPFSEVEILFIFYCLVGEINFNSCFLKIMHRIVFNVGNRQIYIHQIIDPCRSPFHRRWIGKLHCRCSRIHIRNRTCKLSCRHRCIIQCQIDGRAVFHTAFNETGASKRIAAP